MQRLSQFGRRLRARGVPAGPAEVMRAIEVLGTLDMTENDSLYWGLRLTMLRRVEQLDVFDQTFHDFWGSSSAVEEPESLGSATDRQGEASRSEGDEEAPAGTSEATLSASTHDASSSGDSEVDEDSEAGVGVAYSAMERVGTKDFAEYTPEDYLRLQEALIRLRAGGPWRTSRRVRSARHGAIDVRATVRSSLRTEGHPVTLARRRPRLKQRQLTFVCDVSGSMKPYARAVLGLAHVALRARRRVEVLAFATRLTRITNQLLERDPVAAMASAVDAVVDWSGGTRIGESLAELNRRYRQILYGAVVVIASDGWDLGDPVELACEADLLQRIAHRVIWINPRLQDPGFEPLTRGMSAALPHVDHFRPCHNFASFAELLELLDRT
jgi:uncharacterized protein with von Willebrand factor type A (vWA) domain